MQCISFLQYPSVLCDPSVSELGADWVGAPLGHAAHPHQRLPGEEEDYHVFWSAQVTPFSVVLGC